MAAQPSNWKIVRTVHLLSADLSKVGALHALLFRRQGIEMLPAETSLKSLLQT